MALIDQEIIKAQREHIEDLRETINQLLKENANLHAELHAARAAITELARARKEDD